VKHPVFGKGDRNISLRQTSSALFGGRSAVAGWALEDSAGSLENGASDCADAAKDDVNADRRLAMAMTPRI
jgi:hypothetical protein